MTNRGFSPEITWRAGCHDCHAQGTGKAANAEAALDAIEAWKFEHRRIPGCAKAYTWSSYFRERIESGV